MRMTRLSWSPRAGLVVTVGVPAVPVVSTAAVDAPICAPGVTAEPLEPSGSGGAD
jgi:hypothetical protein